MLPPYPSAHPLLLDGTAYFMDRWNQVQSTFVDDPRRAVEQARQLVEDVLGQLARTFEDERTRLESKWAAGGEPSTEEFRQSLQRHREFFHRLLDA